VRVRSEKFTTVAFAAVAVALVASGCGGSKSSTTGTTAQPLTAQSSAATTGGGSAGSPAASTAASSSSAAGGAATSSATTGGGSVASPASSTRAAGKAPGTPTGFTRPGAYTYTVSGTAKQPIGGTQQISGTDTTTFDAPNGSTQHSKDVSQRGSSEQTLKVVSSGLYVEDIHISQQGFDEDFHPVGTALYFPAKYATGSHWSWQAKSTDGKYSLDVASKVSGTSTARVAGKSDKALLVDSTLHITGNGVDLNVQQRDWISTVYALILKEHSTSSGTAFGASFTSDVTRQLRSTTPS